MNFTRLFTKSGLNFDMGIVIYIIYYQVWISQSINKKKVILIFNLIKHAESYFNHPPSTGVLCLVISNLAGMCFNRTVNAGLTSSVG